MGRGAQHEVLARARWHRKDGAKAFSAGRSCWCGWPEEPLEDVTAALSTYERALARARDPRAGGSLFPANAL